MKIIANHAHVFQDGVNKGWMIDDLRAHLDECGIDAAVCFAPFKEYYRDEGKNMNRWLADEIKNDSRFYGFGVIDYSRGNVKDQVREIYDLGLNGIKFHPAVHRVKVDSPEAFEVYEVAEELGLPMTFHTGIHHFRISHDHVLLYDEVAYNFPRLKMSLEHMGGDAFFPEATAVMCSHLDQIYAGITSVFDNKLNKFWYLGKERVKKLLHLAGPSRLIFGLDFPYNSAEFTKNSIRDLTECVLEMGMGERELEMVFGGNLLEFIRK